MHLLHHTLSATFSALFVHFCLSQRGCWVRMRTHSLRCVPCDSQSCSMCAHHMVHTRTRSSWHSNINHNEVVYAASDSATAHLIIGLLFLWVTLLVIQVSLFFILFRNTGGHTQGKPTVRAQAVHGVHGRRAGCVHMISMICDVNDL